MNGKQYYLKAKYYSIIKDTIRDKIALILITQSKIILLVYE